MWNNSNGPFWFPFKRKYVQDLLQMALAGWGESTVRKKSKILVAIWTWLSSTVYLSTPINSWRYVCHSNFSCDEKSSSGTHFWLPGKTGRSTWIRQKRISEHFSKLNLARCELWYNGTNYCAFKKIPLGPNSNGIAWTIFYHLIICDKSLHSWEMHRVDEKGWRYYIVYNVHPHTNRQKWWLKIKKFQEIGAVLY